MAYEGETLYACPAYFFCGGSAEAVVVSGDGLNVCGHLLLCAGGRYFHVAGFASFPKHMTEIQFQRYLRETGKRVLRRTRFQIPNPTGAQQKLEQLLNHIWFWGVLPHNCVSFVEEIIQAGGLQAGLYGNCPAGAEAFR